MGIPRLIHWEWVKRIKRFLSGTNICGLRYKVNSSDEVVVSYKDQDFTEENHSRKSTSGLVDLLVGNPIN